MDRMRQLYEEQLAYLNARDAKALVEHHYHPNATLITFDHVTTGRDALVALFEAYIKHMGFFQVRTDKFQATEDSIFVEATLTSKAGTSKVYDVFVLREGKITHHFAGVL
jgi:predicted SnoaL-like aldol condensation-catalyzing enzyme